jgi:hypothetical protein
MTDNYFFAGNQQSRRLERGAGFRTHYHNRESQFFKANPELPQNPP